MSEWKEYKLGEVITIKYGKDHKNLKDGKYPVYGSGGIMRYADNFLYDKESILIPRKGSLNNIFYREKAFWTVDTMFYSEIDTTKVFPKFLYYQLTLVDFENLNVGSAVPSLTIPIINDIDISLPSLPEQKRIASILSSLDDKIDLLHRENKTLEAMAETLFRQWFIEEAKEDWKEGKLGDYINETIGGEWGKENPEGDFTKVVQCIRGTDIADLNIGLANKAPIRFVKESKFEKIEPRNGDIIMEISGGTENQSTGRVVYINEDVKTFFQYPIVFSNFCRLLRVDEKYSYFLYCYLKYLYDQDEYFNLENGSSGIKNLDYKALLYDLTYPMPKDKRIIFKFNDNVSLYFKRINKNKKQIQTLTQTRDSLLPKLMNGEVKI